MHVETVAWLAILLVLAVLFVVTLRRMSALIARTRDLERYQRSVIELDRRFAALVEPLVHELDLVRRHAGDPGALRAALDTARPGLDALAADGRTLGGPAPLVPTTVALTAELDRAVRATDLVRHGLEALGDPRANREQEAQTALKRSALNLRHARDAFSRLVREVQALRPVDVAPGSAARAAAVAPLAPYGEPEADDDEGRFEPRM